MTFTFGYSPLIHITKLCSVLKICAIAKIYTEIIKQHIYTVPHFLRLSSYKHWLYQSLL